MHDVHAPKLALLSTTNDIRVPTEGARISFELELTRDRSAYFGVSRHSPGQPPNMKNFLAVNTLHLSHDLFGRHSHDQVKNWFRGHPAPRKQSLLSRGALCPGV